MFLEVLYCLYTPPSVMTEWLWERILSISFARDFALLQILKLFPTFCEYAPHFLLPLVVEFLHLHPFFWFCNTPGQMLKPPFCFPKVCVKVQVCGFSLACRFHLIFCVYSLAIYQSLLSPPLRSTHRKPTTGWCVCAWGKMSSQCNYGHLGWSGGKVSLVSHEEASWWSPCYS